MQNLYDELNTLDKRCYEEYFLSEDLLMEHAANGMARYIKKHFKKNSKIIVCVGSSNNGADGIALARMLHGDYEVFIFYAKEPKSRMALLQQKRADALKVEKTDEIFECDVIVDAIIGTGFKGELDPIISSLIDTINSTKAYKIACDTPSGMKFNAGVTLSMGALKKAFFQDGAKDKVGKIKLIDLGISRSFYEKNSAWKLLDMSDISLPLRDKNDSHKGSYGHLALLCGEKNGASTISALAALSFGSGLVTLISEQNISLPYTLMSSKTIPKNATALALGMGLGESFSDEQILEFLKNDVAIIADADIFYKKELLLRLLQKNRVVLTPHPKEFVSLLELCGLACISVDELQKQRFYYSELFCKTYPNITLLLKGANVIIAKDKSYYINPHGRLNLAKGGSGDVLSGLIGSLLAQGYSDVSAAINGSLALAKLSQNYKGANFSLTPKELIKGIKWITN